MALARSLLVYGVSIAAAGFGVAGLSDIFHLPPWGVGLGLAGLLVSTALFPALYLKRRQSLLLRAFITWDPWTYLPWISLPFLVWLYHQPWGSGAPVALAIASQVKLPWMAAFASLSWKAYVVLLLFGGVWVGHGILKLGLWLWALAGEVKAGRRLSFSLLMLTAFAFGAWLQGWPAAIYPPTGDEVHYLMMARSLAVEGSVDLKQTFAEKSWKKDYPAETLDFHGHPDRQGRWISRHMPALSVAVLPGYLALGRWGAAMMNLLFASAAAAMLYLLARRMAASPMHSLLAYGLVLVTAPWSTYGYLLYPVACGFLLTTLGCYWAGESHRPGPALAVAMACGLLPWFHQSYVALSAVLAGFALWPMLRKRAWASLAILGGVGLISGAGFVMAFITTYQEALVSGDYSFGFHGKYFLSAVVGLAVDRYYGALIVAPVLLAAAVGLVRAAKEKQYHALLILSLLAASTLTAALFVDWTAFTASFPRLIAPAGFLLFAGVALYSQGAGREKPPVLFRALAGWGVASAILSWILPPLLYELPRARIFEVLAHRGVPAFWELLPSLSHQPGWLAIGQGVLVLGVFAWCFTNLEKKS